MYLGWEASELLPLFQFIAGFNLRNPYEPEIFLDIIMGTDGISSGFVKSLFAADRLCVRAEVVSTC